MKKKIYISGPMTGLPDYNRAAFEWAAVFLLLSGYIKVVNPVDIVDKLKTNSWFLYMFFDIKALIFCRSIYMLKGWENSKGANIEFKIAKLLRMEIIYQEKC